MKQINISQQKRPRHGVLLYFMCGMAITALGALSSFLLVPDTGRISVYASPAPVPAAIPISCNAAVDAEQSWITASGVTVHRDTESYVEGTSSTRFLIDNTFGTGTIAASPVMTPGNDTAGALSFWIKVSVQSGNADDLRLETSDGTDITLTNEFQPATWYHVSWEPADGQTGPVTLKVDNDEFQGCIWLDGIGAEASDCPGLSFDNLVSPPPACLLNAC